MACYTCSDIFTAVATEFKICLSHTTVTSHHLYYLSNVLAQAIACKIKTH